MEKKQRFGGISVSYKTTRRDIPEVPYLNTNAY